MLREKWLLIVSACFSCFFANATQMDADFPVISTVLSQIQLSVLQNMSFGRHTVVTSNTDVTSTQAAQISISADAGAAVTGSFGSASTNLVCQSSSCASQTIAVDTFICSGAGFNPDCSGQIGRSAQSVVSINAVMHLTPADSIGTYTGTQTFSLTYS